MRIALTITGCVALVLFTAQIAIAAPCTLLSVDKPEKAKLRVYFTKFVKEDTTTGKYKACRIVRTAEKDSETFYITPFRQDATVVVHQDNWPR
jgi:hypothetical protein